MNPHFNFTHSGLEYNDHEQPAELSDDLDRALSRDVDSTQFGTFTPRSDSQYHLNRSTDREPLESYVPRHPLHAREPPSRTINPSFNSRPRGTSSRRNSNSNYNNISSSRNHRRRTPQHSRSALLIQPENTGGTDHRRPTSLFAGPDFFEQRSNDRAANLDVEEDTEIETGTSSNRLQSTTSQQARLVVGSHRAIQPDSQEQSDSLAAALTADQPNHPGGEGWEQANFEEIEETLTGLPGIWRRMEYHTPLRLTLAQKRSEVPTPNQSKETFEEVDGKDVARALSSQDATAVLMYQKDISVDPNANDIWPTLRDVSKVPARYYRIDKALNKQQTTTLHRRPSKVQKLDQSSDVKSAQSPVKSSGRPIWALPVELIEMIAGYLNRDDVKALRLVSRELNQNVSQLLFKTVVVPFNTEIYGMLGREQELDIKGKKKAAASNFVWKNANGDDVYNGHGLDVFRGFGSHIMRYGMSFEVTEEALAKPPVKVLTERHESFWGTYNWPFVEYRRFENIAGLELAADETPRMKTAFSELTKVQELALSVDAGLGWLNGPDRSIRARILQRPPEVFGTLKKIPDRRTHAQQELWRYIEACHAAADSDVTLASLYRLDAKRSPSDTRVASLALKEQPEMPFVEPRIISEAIPHNTDDLIPPMSFDDPEVLNRFVATQKSSATGILYTSKIQPVDAGQLLSSVIPSTLTRAQKEWLMETEWAQRAFISSYMLSIIDNPKTFESVHTLNISRLPDRYVPLLNRQDFWVALPRLSNVTLLVLPSWRTIAKDDAGVVDTPNVNPTKEIGSVVALLQRIVKDRPEVNTLTIGWATGGEHAEGIHARNKLLQPAPLLGGDMVTNQNAVALRSSLLQCPHVERLTLKNCWITPLALREFVKIHDRLSLQHLVLDSVSLTSVLRPQQDNHLGVLWAPGLQQAQALHAHALALQTNGQGQQHNIMNPVQFFQAQFQLLQIQLHQLQALPGGNPHQVHALQHQLQHLATHGPMQGHQTNNGNTNQPQVHGALMNTVQQILQHHGQWPQGPIQGHAPAPAAPVPAAAAALVTPSTTVNQTLLTGRPRDGSWLETIDIMTPGPNLRDFGSEFSQADEERKTSLKTIRFISCGYARLSYSPFDQDALEDFNGGARQRADPIFAKRAQTLLPSMLCAKWPLLGQIVQEVSAEEMAALYAGWGLETGWKNEDEAKAVQFDGLLPGGTGRFTGTVRAADRVDFEGAANN